MEMMLQCYTTRKINHGCNSSFFSLIPKARDPQSLADFRPISLIGVVFKIISKTLVNQLKKVMSTLSSSTQPALVILQRGFMTTDGLIKRNIFDGPLITSEVVLWAKKKILEIMFFKVGFEKAYDSVN
ncbi:hypothetical protein Hdeb2414_s0022g00613331 [Helianthus debilis subsp. tardiflorus]